MSEDLTPPHWNALPHEAPMTAPGWAEEVWRAAVEAWRCAKYLPGMTQLDNTLCDQAAATELPRLCVSREEHQAVVDAAKAVLDACYLADASEDLPEHIDGSLLDKLSLALWPEIWTEEQVAALNAFQDRGDVHPFTCGSDNRSDDAHKAAQQEEGGDLGQLVATRQGWICPACSYRQFWAHDFMFARAALKDQSKEAGDGEV